MILMIFMDMVELEVVSSAIAPDDNFSNLFPP